MLDEYLEEHKNNQQENPLSWPLANAGSGAQSLHPLLISICDFVAVQYSLDTDDSIFVLKQQRNIMTHSNIQVINK